MAALPPADLPHDVGCTATRGGCDFRHALVDVVELEA
jgi:hypothetical protein